MISTKSDRNENLRKFDREMLRSDFVGVFWSAIERRRREGKYTMQKLADALGRDKSVVSKWFSGEPNNWTIDTIADIAGALDLDLVIRAKERHSGVIHAPHGVERRASAKSANRGRSTEIAKK